jgi:hypothetical protein
MLGLSRICLRNGGTGWVFPRSRSGLLIFGTILWSVWPGRCFGVSLIGLGLLLILGCFMGLRLCMSFVSSLPIHSLS